MHEQSGFSFFLFFSLTWSQHLGGRFIILFVLGLVWSQTSSGSTIMNMA